MTASVPVRQWAEQVLLGTTLDDKLWRPASLSDARPGTAIDAPRAPGRAPGWRLAEEGGGGVIPRDDELFDPLARGRLLHSFANHELLALELMALALLRFPEAPAAFRRGLVQTLRDEQIHLRLYLQRMRELGVQLGQHPLSGFFWRVMAPMASPLDYVAHMALTFEQANLDFARSHAAALRTVGDETTAAILDRVYADEIGHVKLGVIWFERWRERGPSLFDAHRRALRTPMTPRRARGHGFDRPSRACAGLPADYVERLSCFEASRGRPPVVHWFDPSAELSLAIRGRYTPSAATRTLTEDLELLPAFAAAAHDLVLVRRAPSLSHLRRLADMGLSVPEHLELGPSGRDVPLHTLPPRLAALRPWGWGPPARAMLQPLGDRVNQPPPPAHSDAVLHAKTTWAPLRAELSRVLDEPWLDTPDTLGLVATEPEATWDALARLRARGHETVVIKAPFGTSGRNAQRIDALGPTVAQRGWLRRTLSIQGAVLLEPWLHNIADVSLRITVDSAGRARIDDLGRFLTDGRGQYLGAVLGPLPRALPSVVARWLRDDGRDPKRVHRVTEAVAAAVATLVHAQGYTGPVGIDGLIYRDRDGALHLRPIVEVNVRPNFGHVAHGLHRRLAQGTAGLLVMLSLADLPAGVSLDDALARAGTVLPTVTVGRAPRLRRGVVPLNDPSQAQSTVALLLAAASRDKALAALRAAAPAVADRVARSLPAQRPRARRLDL
ncbi:MAG: DUF455 family protein [Nannocystaceae bacterium]